MSKLQASRNDVLSQLRLPLMVLVVIAHSYGGVTEGYNVLTGGWDWFEVLKITVGQTLTRVAMPTFFVMSGYLFFANVASFNREVYLQKMIRRAKTLLMPYIIWNLLMAIKLNNLSLSAFWTPANMPLWFLRDLILVSLATPIIYMGVRKLGWWIFVVLLPIYLTGAFAVQPGPNPYALCFFTFGAYISIQKKDIVETCMKFEKPAYGISVILAVAMLLTYGRPIFPFLLLCFRIVGVVVMFCLTNRILSMTNKRIPKVACKASYFIYLTHYVFFLSFIDAAFFTLFGTSTGSLCAHYLLCPLIKVAIFVGFYLIYSYLCAQINRNEQKIQL